MTLRPCTAFDLEEMLFEPRSEDYKNGKLASYKDSMLCLDDPNKFDLKGQFSHADGNFFKLSLIQCEGETDDGRQCATQEENEDFFKDTVIQLAYNRQIFST